MSPSRHEETPASATGAVFLSLAIVLLFIVPQLRWALLPFVLASLLAYLLSPLVEMTATGLRLSRFQAAAVVYVFLLTILAVATFLGAPLLFRELEGLFTDFQSISRNLAHSFVDDHAITILGKNMDPVEIADSVTRAMRDWLGTPGRVIEIATVSFAGLFGGILVLVLLFYMLAQGPEIFQGILWLAPPARRDVTERIWLRLSPLLWRYVLGLLVVVVCATIAAYIGLGLFLGLRHAFLLALMTGMLEMIPVIGPGASALIGGLAAAHKAAGIGPVLGYAVYVVVLRLTIDQILGPLVLGKAAILNPVVIIFCFLMGGGLLGITGVILAVPAAITIKTSIAVLRRDPPSGERHL